MSYENRYKENRGILTEQQMSILQHKRVLLIGCGGIGGNVANQLIRLGVANLSIVDFDKFDESNLNRQLFSNMDTLHKSKVDVLRDQLLKINPSVDISVFNQRIETMDETIYHHFDYMIDAVDKPKTKVYLNEMSTKHNIPLLHGACAGWYAQVGWIEPGCLLLKELYEDSESGIESELRNPVFTPGIAASIMVSEFVKYVFDIPVPTVNRLILIDLKTNNIILSDKGESNGKS